MEDAATLTEAEGDRAWAFAECRVGLRVERRKRWYPCGVRPARIVHDRDEWMWLYAGVEPVTGLSLFLLLPQVTTAWFAPFLAAFAQEVAGERAGSVRDGSGSHHADIPWPRSSP